MSRIWSDGAKTHLSSSFQFKSTCSKTLGLRNGNKLVFLHLSMSLAFLSVMFCLSWTILIRAVLVHLQGAFASSSTLALHAKTNSSFQVFSVAQICSDEGFRNRGTPNHPSYIYILYYIDHFNIETHGDLGYPNFRNPQMCSVAPAFLWSGLL